MRTTPPKKVWKAGSTRVKAGEKIWSQWHIQEGNLSTKIPVILVHGAHEGPHAVVVANQHGLELIGIEVCRLLAEFINPKKFCGTLAIFPSANPAATITEQQCIPEAPLNALAEYDPKFKYPEYDMFTKWPGRTGGLLIERIAHEIWHNAVLYPRKASAFIDLHCFRNVHGIYVFDDFAAQLAPVAGIKNVVNLRAVDAARFGKITHTSGTACHRFGIPCLTLEFGPTTLNIGPLHRDEAAAGLQAVKNILIFLGMLTGKPVYQDSIVVCDPWRDDFVGHKKNFPPSYLPVLAEESGVVVVHKRSYDFAKKGETICHVVNPYTAKTVQRAVAPISGFLYDVFATKGICRKGDRLLAIGAHTFINPKTHAEKLKAKRMFA